MSTVTSTVTNKHIKYALTIELFIIELNIGGPLLMKIQILKIQTMPSTLEHARRPFSIEDTTFEHANKDLR